MKKLIITRPDWLRGNPDDSYLLRESDDKMCCLGFLCLDLGLDPADITDVVMPNEINEYEAQPDLPEWLLKERLYKKDVPEPLVIQMADVNDSPDLTDPEREAQLTELFKKVNIKVEFRDA